MNSSVQPSPSATIIQLEKARKLALGDSAYYSQIVSGVLPIIGPSAALELRRWGSDFLAETLASPMIQPEQKQQLGLAILDTLKEFLEKPAEDAAVVKSVVQTATSIYPLIFQYIVYNPTDESAWQKMVAIKSNILKRMDASPGGVKVCCIKFVQRVVQVQTPGLIADPRRPEQNEISLALVPNNHPLIPPSNLQAEAFGLLDRLLSVFQETTSDALLVTATVNCVGVLVQTRASVANRILNAILNFNPFRGVSLPVAPRTRVMLKSMERTIRAFLLNLNKRNANHPLAGRVQGYLDLLQQSRREVLDDGALKRVAGAEPTDGLDAVKRQRLGADVPAAPDQHPDALKLPAGPISLAQLFTLTENETHKTFDAYGVKPELLFKAIVPILAATDQTQLDNAVNAVRARYLYVTQAQNPSTGDALEAGMQTSDDEEEYSPAEDAEQMLNRIDSTAGADVVAAAPVALGPYIIPQPAPLTDGEAIEYGKGAVARVFSMIQGTPEQSNKLSKPGFNRVAASSFDRDTWLTIVTRLATRSLTGLETHSTQRIKSEETFDESDALPTSAVGDFVRDALYRYIIEDFRRRIDVAIAWLNEEWYNDQVQKQGHESPTENYDKWTIKVFDGILPYLDAKDKVLIRFLSEIPSITTELLERVKRLARDPERVSLAVNSIYYLTLYRPPVRNICIDALEDLYHNYDDAKAPTTKLLQKLRPQALQSSSNTPGSNVKSELSANTSVTA